MAAEKVVPGHTGGGKSRVMAWEKPGRDQYFWRAPVEIDAARVGWFFVFANPSLPRWWNFKLSLRDEEVYRWDIRPMTGGHDNPPGCPDGFPPKAPEKEHEHVWVEGLDLRCAHPLDGLTTSDHRAIFDSFCHRTHVRFEPTYVAPEAFEQQEMDL